MAIDPRISLMGQQANLPAAVMGGLQIGENIRNRGVRDTILRQSEQMNQMKIAQAQGQYQYQLYSSLKDVPMEERAALYAQNLPMLQQMGVTGIPDLSDKGLDQGLMLTRPFVAQPEGQQAKSPFGAISPSDFTPESLAKFQATNDYSVLVPVGGKADKPSISNVNPSYYTRESLDAYSESGKYSDLVPLPTAQVVNDENFIKIQEETRKELRTESSGLVNNANVVYTNYAKLENLAEEMAKGNRSAVAQGLVALVKLGDPSSVVKEEELRQALGAKAPLAAVVDALRGAGVDGGVVTSIMQSLDPLNPDTVNIDQIMATANAMMLPNIENILGTYDVAMSRGKQQLSEQGYSSIFGVRPPVMNKLMSLNSQITAQMAQQPAKSVGQPTSQPMQADPNKPPVPWRNM